MSFVDDIIEAKKLMKKQRIFKAATPEQRDNRPQPKKAPKPYKVQASENGEEMPDFTRWFDYDVLAEEYGKALVQKGLDEVWVAYYSAGSLEDEPFYVWVGGDRNGAYTDYSRAQAEKDKKFVSEGKKIFKSATPEQISDRPSLPDCRWVDGHSVNCLKCGMMFDERNGIRDPYDGGDICPDCVEDMNIEEAEKPKKKIFKSATPEQRQNRPGANFDKDAFRRTVVDAINQADREGRQDIRHTLSHVLVAYQSNRRHELIRLLVSLAKTSEDILTKTGVHYWKSIIWSIKELCNFDEVEELNFMQQIDALGL